MVRPRHRRLAWEEEQRGIRGGGGVAWEEEQRGIRDGAWPS